MKSGLLWYDASSNPLDRKIADAIKRYQEKFGIAPNTIFVNEKDYRPETTTPPHVRVSAKRTILPNHVWVGTSDK